MNISALVVTAGVAGAIAGVASVVVAVRVGIPRSKLICQTTRLVPLFADPELAGCVDAYRGGVRVSDPFVAEFRLVNHGAWDIPIAAFARPIELDAQVEIVDVLRIWMVPATSDAPAVRHQGSALSVEPFLIGRRQQVCLRLLTDGRPRMRARASIERVEVQAVGPPPRPPSPSPRRRWRWPRPG
jgi:hypothetical protein